MTVYAIYKHPHDAPDEYVVRAWLVSDAGTQPGDSWRATTLEQARTFLPEGVTLTPGILEPNPKIVETYL